MKKIKQLKEKCKEQVVLIKEANARYKKCQTPEQFMAYWEWRKGFGIQGTDLSKRYRHWHIAYCMLRGRKYEQVENKVNPGNEPNWTVVEEIMKQWQEPVEVSEVSNG